MSGGTAITPSVEAPGSQPGSHTAGQDAQPLDPVEYLGSLDPSPVDGTDDGSPQSNPPSDPATKPDDAVVQEDEPEQEPDGKTEKPDEEPDAKQDADERAEFGRRAQERIAELTARRQRAEEQAEALKGQVAQLEEQAQLNLGVHPMFLTPEEAQAIQSVNELEARAEDLFTKKLDGYDDPHDPAKSMTQEDARREYSRVQREILTLKPKASLAFERALAEQTEALKLGREVLAARKAKGGAPATAARNADTQARPSGKPKVSPPKLPSAPSVAPGSVVAGTNAGPSKERFQAAGASDEAAAAELSRM
jgi:hypothetical protein